MAKAAKQAGSPLTLTPQALTRALVRAARRAQQLADAYGAKVPVEREVTPRSPASVKRKA
jgi:hypothetical protein